MKTTAKKYNQSTNVFAQSYIITTPTKNKFSFLDSKPDRQNNSHFAPPRPKSTMLARRKQQVTLKPSTYSKPTITANFFQKIEDQLETRLKSELSSYLRSKLRQFINKTHHTNTVKQFMTATIDQQTQTTSKLESSKPHFWFGQSPTKPTDSKKQNPYLISAKQRITRLIDRKNQREANYSAMSNHIREKCISHEKQRIRSFNTVSPERTIDNEQWDQQWCQEQKLEAKRYRNRLLQKFKKKQPENNTTRMNDRSQSLI